MPTLEIAFAPYKQTLTKEQLDAAWKAPEKVLSAAPGCEAVYTGLMPTHPGILAVIIIWENIHAHHRFMHSESYGPFMMNAAPILAGDIEVVHLEVTDSKTLKTTLTSPVTQISHLSVKKGYAAKFLKEYHENYKKLVAGGEKNHGMWMQHSYEAPFSFYAFLGWDSEQDHYDVMQKEKYLAFRDSFKDCIVPENGVKIYHLELTKVYGDW